MTPSKWLVAGLGNPLQGSDAFGPVVIARLRGEPDLPPGAQLLDAHTDALACLDHFLAFDGVVLVDAFLGPAPREVVTVDEHAFATWNHHAVSCHELSPLVAVRLFRLLQPASRTRFVLVGLRVDPEAFGSAITPADARAGAEAVLRVLRAA